MSCDFRLVAYLEPDFDFRPSLCFRRFNFSPGKSTFFLFAVVNEWSKLAIKFVSSPMQYPFKPTLMSNLVFFEHVSTFFYNRELDFLTEVENMHRVRDNLIKGQIDVIVPSAIEGMCTSHVMVMEFIEGFKVRVFA